MPLNLSQLHQGAPQAATFERPGGMASTNQPPTVELTKDSESDDEGALRRAQKRQRTHAEPDGDDVLLVEAPPRGRPAAGPSRRARQPAAEEDMVEDLVITHDRGMVSSPHVHPRHTQRAQHACRMALGRGGWGPRREGSAGAILALVELASSPLSGCSACTDASWSTGGCGGLCLGGLAPWNPA